jgi:hypothetical protein
LGVERVALGSQLFGELLAAPLGGGILVFPLPSIIGEALPLGFQFSPQPSQGRLIGRRVGLGIGRRGGGFVQRGESGGQRRVLLVELPRVQVESRAAFNQLPGLGLQSRFPFGQLALCGLLQLGGLPPSLFQFAVSRFERLPLGRQTRGEFASAGFPSR